MTGHRTTKQAVLDVLQQDYDYLKSPSLQAYLDTAKVITDRVQTGAAGRNKPLTIDELERVECWLAAHYYCMADPTYKSKNTDGASASFQGQDGKYLEQTRYGQTALRIDWSGFLEAMDKRKVAGVIWLGKNPGDQIDYEDRAGVGLN
jgi:hypothetical protein